MSAVRTMTVTVSAEIAEALDQSVRSGEYTSESEALADAVQSWDKRRTFENIRHRIRQSIDDENASTPIDDAEAELKRFMAER